jgi:hypothetical protein
VTTFIGESVQTLGAISISDNDVKGLLSSLDVDNRLFMVGVIWSIATNLFVFNETDKEAIENRKHGE